jgi:hypothetical protein
MKQNGPIERDFDSRNISTRGVSHCGLAIYNKKYLKAKEELWKFEYFTMQNYNLQKKSSIKKPKPFKTHNPITNLKFQHKPKNIIFRISSYENRPTT